MVTHEAPLTAGFAGEIASAVQEHCFLSRGADSACVAPTSFSHSPPRSSYPPDELKVFDAVRRVSEY